MGIAARLKAARALFSEIEQDCESLPEPARTKILAAAQKGKALF